MAFGFKDYYAVLGLTPEASAQDIRRAFRALARQHHPDLNPGAEAKFREVHEAYQILSNETLRRRYDKMGHVYRFSGFHAPDEVNPFDDGESDAEEWNELNREEFSDFFKRFFEPEEEAADGAAEDVEREILLTLEEACKGGVRLVKVRRSIPCKQCFGTGRLNQQLCTVCHGHGSVEHSENCRIKIPRGIRPGQLLRVPQFGERSTAGDAGDLLLRVRFAAHDQFRRADDDILCAVNVAPWEAALGAEIEIPSLDGSVSLKIPKGAQHGGKVRVRGKGLPRRDGGAGDLVATLHVRIPESLSLRERELWEALATASEFSARTSAPEPAAAQTSA